MRIGFGEWMKNPAKYMEQVNRYNSKKCPEIDLNKVMRSKKMHEYLSKSRYTLEEKDDEFIIFDENGKVKQRVKKGITADGTAPTDGSNENQPTTETTHKK